MSLHSNIVTEGPSAEMSEYVIPKYFSSYLSLFFCPLALSLFCVPFAYHNLFFAFPFKVFFLDPALLPFQGPYFWHKKTIFRVPFLRLSHRGAAAGLLCALGLKKKPFLPQQRGRPG